MSDLKAAIAKGLMSEISGADPVVNGEEWDCFEAEADGADISIMLYDESGKTYGARLTVVEVWED